MPRPKIEDPEHSPLVVKVVPKAGDVVIFNTHLLHMATDNESPMMRKSLIYAYSHFWVKHYANAVPSDVDRLATTLAFEIERTGYRAFPVPAGRPYNDERMMGLISHKLAAHLSGSGWIGKNCLLITKEHGPRVRWVTVLTDAPLTSTGGALASGDECKECSICVDLCPAGAFTGVPFNPAEDVEVRFHRSECRKYLSQRDRAYDARVCGLCVYVCPHGWSAKRKSDGQRTSPEVLRRQLTGVRRAFEASLEQGGASVVAAPAGGSATSTRPA